MHIIGTSGHVDHGKTALIEALTGINADRLPEERRRGMTIDLGFAHFAGENGEPVGVIDVPGHERFIRNMVAGAWSLSCAVLVVAGTEGWMQQTEDHARVLAAMGIPEIVCALTKVDLIEEDMREIVSELAQEELTRVFGRIIPVIPVSSVTGEGIGELRSHLLTVLKGVRRKEKLSSPFIHIDRVFSVKGAGTVITGSLAGGPLNEGDVLTILPGRIETKIRGIQSYYSTVQTAFPVSRVACNLQGLRKEEVSRGCIATVRPGDFWVENEFVIQIEALDEDNAAIRNHMEIEMACGTGHYIGRIHFLRTEGFARIVLEEEVAVSWLDTCLFIRRGGHHILGKGKFLWAGEIDRHLRIRLAQILAAYPAPQVITEEAILRFLMKEWHTARRGGEKKALKRFIAEQQLSARLIQDTWILEERLLKEVEKLNALCSRPGGVSRAEYLQVSGLPHDVGEYLIERGLNMYEITGREQVLLSPEQLGGDYALSPLAQRIMSLLTQRDDRGLQLKEITEAGAKRELRNLVRIGKVVALEGDVYFTRERFDQLSALILEGLEKGTVFAISDAKDRTGLSRRYMLPLLNRMEANGLVERSGDNRVVL